MKINKRRYKNCKNPESNIRKHIFNTKILEFDKTNKNKNQFKLESKSNNIVSDMKDYLEKFSENPSYPFIWGRITTTTYQ